MAGRIWLPCPRCGNDNVWYLGLSWYRRCNCGFAGRVDPVGEVVLSIREWKKLYKTRA